MALYAQAAVALLCAALLLGGGPVITAFAVAAGAAALGNVLLAVLLPRHPTRLRLAALYVSWPMIPMFVAFSVPAPPALVGLASSAAVLVFLRSRFGLLRSRARKLWLTLHVGFSVGWLGAAMAMLVLAIVGARTSDLDLRHYAYEIMHVFDLAIVIPLFAAVQESLWVREAVASTRVDRSMDLDGTDMRLWVCFIVFSLLLWAATALSSYKPWGRTQGASLTLAHRAG